MTRRAASPLTWCTLTLALLWGVLACDLPGSSGPLDAAGKAMADCPDTGNASAIAGADWSGSFGLDASSAAQLKGGLIAALELRGLAASIDADLKTACGGLAKDLGAGQDFPDGTAACKAAMDAMTAARTKIGGSLKVSLAIQPPRCAASMDAMASCVAECDASIEPGEVDLKCEGGEIVGECSGQCSGTCHMDAGGQCSGTCQGACQAKFKGKCGGECKGKCDGKQVSGTCKGTCAGSCSGGAEGSCGGTCEGSCKLKAEASCQGECQGQCSAEWKAPSCTGTMKPPKASAECQAQCETRMTAKVECKPARVVINVTGGANAEAAAQYKAALQKHLPLVLKVAVGLKDQAMSAAANVQAVVQAAQEVVASAKSNAQAGARLAACVAAPFKGALDAAASLKANVNVSVEVKASASASAGGSAAAG